MRIVVVGAGVLGTPHAWAAIRHGHEVDATLCPEEAGRGRPYPDLVLGALLVTGADDVAAVAVVGDTASDMESGCRAGASRRIGVLTGAHDEETLRAAGATDVVPTICEVPTLLG